jgi:hypothetical protein
MSLIGLILCQVSDASARCERAKCCSSCYDHRPIDAVADHLGDRCFATTRFRCTKIRHTGAVCGCLGSVAIEPSVLLPVGGEVTLAFLFCGTCQPSWEINHVPIDKPPWSRLNRKSNDRFRCPACGKAVAWAVHGPTWRPGYSDSKSAVDHTSGAAIPTSACAALTRICMKCDAGHSGNRGGPAQWVCMWVCAGPNRSLLALGNEQRAADRIIPPIVVEIARAKSICARAAEVVQNTCHHTHKTARQTLQLSDVIAARRAIATRAGMCDRGCRPALPPPRVLPRRSHGYTGRRPRHGHRAIEGLGFAGYVAFANQCIVRPHAA